MNGQGTLYESTRAHGTNNLRDPYLDGAMETGQVFAYSDDSFSEPIMTRDEGTSH